MGGTRQPSERLPSWTEIARLIDRRDPQVIVLEGDRELELRVDAEERTLSLRCILLEPIDPYELDAPPELDVQLLRNENNEEVLQLRVAEWELLPYFLSFCSTVTDAIQVERMDVLSAIRRSIRLFRKLTRSALGLSREHQLGLFGELWVLNRLLDARPSDALASWVGPQGEAHDFRFDGIELEVKTTTTKDRRHRVRLGQLDPSPGSTLYLVSLQMAAAGADGENLGALLARTRKRLAAQGQADAFEQLVEAKYGLGVANENRYRDRLKLRSPTRLVRVDDELPRLTVTDVLSIRRPGMDRLEEVEFVLRAEGLGEPDGSDGFRAILPGPNA
jgi:hypothetical protein